MAVAKKCDRCGKFYDHYPIGNQSGIYNSVCRLRTDGFEANKILYQERHHDLCPDCMDDFKTFMEMGHYSIKEAKEDD